MLRDGGYEIKVIDKPKFEIFSLIFHDLHKA